MKIKYEISEHQSYNWWLNFWQQWDLFIEPIEIDKVYWPNLELVEMPNVVGCYQLISIDKILIIEIDAPADCIEACTALNALKYYIQNK